MAEKYPSLELGPAKVKGPELRSGEFVLYWIEPYKCPIIDDTTRVVLASVFLVRHGSNVTLFKAHFLAFLRAFEMICNACLFVQRV